MKQVAVLLADGFEEGEAVVFIDIMRRLDIHVDVLSCMNTLTLNTYFETKISADYLLTEKLSHSYDAVMMPGIQKAPIALVAHHKLLSFFAVIFLKINIFVPYVPLVPKYSQLISYLKVDIIVLVINLLKNIMMGTTLIKTLLWMVNLLVQKG